MFSSSSSRNLPRDRLTNSSCFWAVLIGIDAYPEKPLKHCVSDVRAMEAYLMNNLGVPKNHIQLFLKPCDGPYPDDATLPSRANIVNALCSLISNPEIRKGDNIIIYFAGHGSSYQCQGHEDTTRPVAAMGHVCAIEALCPSDRGARDENNTIITDITDRELNSILTQICHTKGQKITVILDCCHSASLTRGISDSNVRSVPKLSGVDIKHALRVADRYLNRYPGYESVLGPEWRANMDSHVVVAACGEHQLAEERDGGGVFTKALLGVLTSGDLIDNLTYVGLLSRLKRSDTQIPVVAGRYKDGNLWFR